MQTSWLPFLYLAKREIGASHQVELYQVMNISARLENLE
jgi:hypothetical protein